MAQGFSLCLFLCRKEDKTVTWDEVLHRFAEYQRAAGLSDKTITARESTLRAVAKRTGCPPRRLEHSDLIEFLNRPHHRTKEPLSPGTKHVERSYLSIWGTWMQEEGITAFNPTARLPRVRVPRRYARPLQHPQITDLFTSGIYTPTIDKITIGANTGLRVGEIVKIHEDHYDYQTNEVFTVRKGGFEMWIPVPLAVQEIAHRKRGDGWWFPSTYKNKQFPEGGGHVLMKSASNRICNALRRIGINDPRITAHSLRHFYCSMLLANGTPVQVVQKLMGHTSLATTQFYVQTLHREMSEAVDKIPYIGPDAIPGSTQSANPFLP